jgi:hypothetical protein
MTENYLSEKVRYLDDFPCSRNLPNNVSLKHDVTSYARGYVKKAGTRKPIPSQKSSVFGAMKSAGNLISVDSRKD